MNLQLVGGQLAVFHGAGVVGVQAVLNAQDSIHVVARVHLRDELGGLLHHVQVHLMILAQCKGLDDGADGLSVVALDEIVHLGQHHRQAGHFFRTDLAGEHIGELEGLVFSYFDLIHDKYLCFVSDLLYIGVR